MGNTPDLTSGLKLLSPRLLQAMETAAYIHRKQLRKGTRIPYISHLVGVMHICAQCGGGEDVIIAALLHDSLEDVPGEINAASIEQQFGARVLALVQFVTKDDSLPTWQERAEAYLQHIATAPPQLQQEVYLLVGADKLYNMQSIVLDPASTNPEFWQRFRSTPQQQLWWYHQVYSQCHQYWPQALVREYTEALAALESCIQQVGE